MLNTFIVVNAETIFSYVVEKKCPCCNYQGNMTRMYHPVFSFILAIIPFNSYYSVNNHYYRCPKCNSYYFEQLGIRTIIHDEKLRSSLLCK